MQIPIIIPDGKALEIVEMFCLKANFTGTQQEKIDFAKSQIVNFIRQAYREGKEMQFTESMNENINTVRNEADEYTQDITIG